MKREIGTIEEYMYLHACTYTAHQIQKKKISVDVTCYILARTFTRHASHDTSANHVRCLSLSHTYGKIYN